MKVSAAALAILALTGSATVASAQARQPRDSVRSMEHVGGEGRVAIKTEVAASLARNANISADSAQAIALARVPEGGKVSSGALLMWRGHLTYRINVVPNGKKTVRQVYVDAMNGNVIADQQLGGLNGVKKHAEEHKKEVRARASASDSLAKHP